MAADAQRKAVGIEDEARPRKLPPAERNARLDEVKVELSGLKITGVLEPSHALVDKVVAMQEANELRYLAWHELTAREAEVRGQKSVDYFKADASGNLKMVSAKQEMPADVSTLTRLRFAWQRRGIALQVGKLMSFKMHEEIVDWFQREIDRDPPPGFSRVSLEQVLQADKEIFTRAAELAKEDLSLRADGKLPLDDLILKILNEPRVQALLFPLRGAGPPAKRA
eukprot:9578447-Karenia_brevis.AAC.1